MNQLLLIGSTVALILLILHSWKTRGRAVTLAFFISATIYGLLRENAIWLLMQHLSHGENSGKPYIPQGGFLPEIGHAHLQVAVGWVFSMYLAWTISELILRRIPRFAGRVFMIAGLSGLFMLAICYCMETTAVAVGWWYWDLPTRSALFGNANTLGMEGWFSVVPDFLLPFLVIVCSESRSKWRWLWVLAFPLHILGHMAYTVWVYAYVVYHALELLVVVPMMFGRLRMARGLIQAPVTSSGKIAASLPGIALAIFFAVLTTANLLRWHDSQASMTQVPMLMLCLLAWGRVPVWGVLAASAAFAAGGWAGMEWRALWVFAPAAAYGFLTLLARRMEPLWMRVIPVATVVALSAVSGVSLDRDAGRLRQYIAAWDEGERLFFEGKMEAAEAAYSRADQLRPNEITNFYRGVRLMTEIPPGRVQASARIFEYRIGRVTREFEEMVRRDPELYPTRRDLALYYLLDGRLADAVQQYREIYGFHREDVAIGSLLGWLLLRNGETAEAEGVLDRLAKKRTPPVEALVNLGVIRYSQGRDDEARALWEAALRRDPENLIARANIERMSDPSPDRSIDARYLVRDRAVAHLAAWVNDLAIHAPNRTESERIGLFLEATQMNPGLVPANANLASACLDRESRFYDPRRAVWYARLAVKGARASGKDFDVARTLLLLGRALQADGKPDEARRAIEEGRAKAPPELRGEFDQLLR